jgi:hypothetical protein
MMLILRIEVSSMEDIFTRLAKLQLHIQRCEAIQQRQLKHGGRQQEDVDVAGPRKRICYKQVKTQTSHGYETSELTTKEHVEDDRVVFGPEWKNEIKINEPIVHNACVKLESRAEMDNQFTPNSNELSIISFPNVNIVENLSSSENLSIESNAIDLTIISHSNIPLPLPGNFYMALIPHSPASLQTTVVPSLRTLYTQLFCLYEHLPPPPQESYRRNIYVQCLLSLFTYLQDNGQFGMWADVLKLPGLRSQITSVNKWHDALPAHIHVHELH